MDLSVQHVMLIKSNKPKDIPWVVSFQIPMAFILIHVFIAERCWKFQDVVKYLPNGSQLCNFYAFVSDQHCHAYQPNARRRSRRLRDRPESHFWTRWKGGFTCPQHCLSSLLYQLCPRCLPLQWEADIDFTLWSGSLAYDPPHFFIQNNFTCYCLRICGTRMDCHFVCRVRFLTHSIVHAYFIVSFAFRACTSFRFLLPEIRGFFLVGFRGVPNFGGHLLNEHFKL